MKAMRNLVILLAALGSMPICLRGGKTQVPPGKEVRKEGLLTKLAHSLSLDKLCIQFVSMPCALFRSTHELIGSLTPLVHYPRQLMRKASLQGS